MQRIVNTTSHRGPFERVTRTCSNDVQVAPAQADRVIARVTRLLGGGG